MKRILGFRFAASRTPHSPWDLRIPLCVGGRWDGGEFSLAPGLPSPASAVGRRPTLFGWFIGTMPESESSTAYMTVLRLIAFTVRPVST